MKTLSTQYANALDIDPVRRSRRLERLRKLSELLDEAFHIPGTNIRLGLDSLAGLVPGIGDVATALVSVYMIYQARQLGARKATLIRMATNVGIDALVGAIPVAGDLFDVVWKANKKNLRLLEADLDQRPLVQKHDRVQP